METLNRVILIVFDHQILDALSEFQSFISLRSKLNDNQANGTRNLGFFDE